MSSPILELATIDEIMSELKKRFDYMVFCGAMEEDNKENVKEFTVASGHQYVCLALSQRIGYFINLKINEDTWKVE